MFPCGMMGPLSVSALVTHPGHLVHEATPASLACPVVSVGSTIEKQANEIRIGDLASNKQHLLTPLLLARPLRNLSAT